MLNIVTLATAVCQKVAQASEKKKKKWNHHPS